MNVESVRCCGSADISCNILRSCNERGHVYRGFCERNARTKQGFCVYFFLFSKCESEGYKHHGDCNVLQIKIKGPSMSCLLCAEMSRNHNFSVHWDLFEVVLVSQ